MTSSDMLRLSGETRNPQSEIRRQTDFVKSPILLEVDVAFDLRLRVVHLEAAFFQNLDHAHRLRVDALSGSAVLLRDPDHGGVSAKENVGAGGVELLGEPLFQVATHDQVLAV